MKFNYECSPVLLVSFEKNTVGNDNYNMYIKRLFGKIFCVWFPHEHKNKSSVTIFGHSPPEPYRK